MALPAISSTIPRASKRVCALTGRCVGAVGGGRALRNSAIFLKPSTVRLRCGQEGRERHAGVVDARRMGSMHGDVVWGLFFSPCSLSLSLSFSVCLSLSLSLCLSLPRARWIVGRAPNGQLYCYARVLPSVPLTVPCKYLVILSRRGGGVYCQPRGQSSSHLPALLAMCIELVCIELVCIELMCIELVCIERLERVLMPRIR